MDNIIVSIIIPFKVEDLLFFNQLLNCLNSYNNDSFCEFIFVDDYSNEEISKIAEAKINCIKNSIYLRNKRNSGVSYSRNRGIEASKGKYIMFIDSDDLIDIRFLNDLPTLIKYISQDSLLCLKMEYFVGDCLFASDYHSPAIYKTVSSTQVISDYLYFDASYEPYMIKSACGKLFSKDILVKYNIVFNESLKHYEDALFVSEYSKHVNKTILINGVAFYFYRKNISSASHNYDGDLLNQIGQYYNLFKENCPKLYNTLILDTISLFIPYLIKNESIKRNKISLRNVNSILKTPFIKQAIIDFKKVDISGCINQYLFRLQKLVKRAPRFIWTYYIYFVTRKYLMS